MTARSLSCRTPGTLLVVSLVLGFGLAVPAAHAQATRQVAIPAQVVVESAGAPGELCQTIAFMQLPAVPGAISYSVTYFDSEPRINQQATQTGPPFSGDDVEGFHLPAGTHRFGLSSLSAYTCEGGGGFLSPSRWRDIKAFVIKKLPPGCGGKSTRALGEARLARRELIGADNCPDTPKYTKEEKDYAKERRRAYEDGGNWFQAGAIAAGSGSLYAAATGVGALPAGIIGAEGIILQLAVFNNAYWAQQWGRIAEDPPDKNWRKVVKPIAVDPAGFALPKGLGTTRERQLRALLGNLARSAALADCVAKAIDRGTTALEKSGPLAGRQYTAGAACARENAKLTAALPRLAAPVIAFLRPYDAQVLRDAPKAPRDAKLRRQIAKSVDAVGAGFDVPQKDLDRLKKAAISNTTPPVAGPSVLLQLLVAQATAETARLRTSATVLANASKGK